MTIHRDTLMRRPIRAGRHLARSRPLIRVLSSDRGDVPGWVMITLVNSTERPVCDQ
ncbi:hypothetical protein BRM3_08800 [Brachybacterium huguangmaarense]|uniref:Uncharacterized protein n=1 Tax=Brachybacterium huguangmaarense TaxID=1652028 RepID=A0ABY6FXT9_9MICO|nr:hypothetical protein [Brachybacterium huguangmaarense]UYG15742.1 hypothetical protein BRM3_08800 [Brachybacterium huguangmaarense]